MAFTTTDFASVLLTLGLAAATFAVIAVFSIARARRQGSHTLALAVTRNAAFVWVLLQGLGVLFVVPQSLLSKQFTLDDNAAQRVRDLSEQLLSPPCDMGEVTDEWGAACGNSVGGVPIGPRLLALSGVLLGLICSAAIGWAVYTAARKAGEGNPFHPATASTFEATAIVVIITGTAGPIVNSIATVLAARSLDWSPDADPIPFDVALPLWPFAVAVGFFALTAIFRHGARLENETAGLV